MKNLVLGLILILVALSLLAVWPGVFFWPMIALIEGAIAPVVAFIGLVFLMIGVDELKAPARETVTAVAAPAPRRRRRR